MESSRTLGPMFPSWGSTNASARYFTIAPVFLPWSHTPQQDCGAYSVYRRKITKCTVHCQPQASGYSIIVSHLPPCFLSFPIDRRLFFTILASPIQSWIPCAISGPVLHTQLHRTETFLLNICCHMTKLLPVHYNPTYSAVAQPIG